VLWLLSHGAKPEAITWVMPRDSWLLNRAFFQPGAENLAKCLGALAQQIQILGAAKSLDEMSEQLAAKDIWLRLDPAVRPAMIHGATVSTGELEQLRRVSRVIRGQHVRRLEPGHMILDSDTVATDPHELYVDCTASALGGNVNVRRPVFEADVIRLQMVRQYQPAFSAALIGHVEATVTDDAEKQKFTQVAPMTDTVKDWAAMMAASISNNVNWMANPNMAAWLADCRLDLYTGLISRMPADPARAAMMGMLREKAVQNLRVLAQL
jgi:hypothetical protein